jgi:hypothetical protein
MTLARLIPKLHVLPELRSYQCQSCDEVVTVEHKP